MRVYVAGPMTGYPGALIEQRLGRDLGLVVKHLNDWLT